MLNIYSKLKLYSSLFLLILFTGYYANAQDGAALFKANCATCHSPGERRGTGPGLQGFWDRIPGGDEEGKKQWFLNWVKNSAEIVSSGKDPYINKLYKDYGSVMTPQPHLSDDELMAIKEYVVTYQPPVQDQASGKQNPFAPKKESLDVTTLYWLFALLLIFVILISALGSIRKSLQKAIDKKNDVPSKEDLSFPKNLFHWMGTHKLQTGLIILLLVTIGVLKLYYVLMDVGVYQGYAPVQPIKFSHAIHAGENGINCVYCHHSAERGKTAGIPSVNVCMNCHKGIQEGTWTGTEEISKIYEAAGFDPSNGTYDPSKQKPIKWVRIHNLPDLAYFNHSQHVVVGEIECQTCHGPVEEMHVLEQHSPLTMGWCIDCHRETEVAGLQASSENEEKAKNGYYQTMFEQLRAKHKDVEVFQVEDIGGLECSKCHY